MKCCPRCGLPFKQAGPRAPSRDHILPRNLGGTLVMYGSVRNDQIICQECNQWRGTCGHCWALVACIDSVVQDTGSTRKAVYRKWGLGVLVNELLQNGIRRPPKEPRQSLIHAMRRNNNADRVQIGMAVARVGIEAFVWPADTPEKVEHNFRALLRGGYKPKGSTP